MDSDCFNFEDMFFFSMNDLIVFVMLHCFWIYLQVLKAFHYPFTITAVQFAVGTVLVLFMWGFNLYKRPKITGAQVFGHVLS